ncbi:MAG: hypothetical protein Fur007_07620 [Rhodoferax sp.]
MPVGLGLVLFGLLALVLWQAWQLRRLRQRLAQDQADWAQLRETVFDGFWQVDAQGRLRDVNDGYCSLSGYSRTELLGLHIADLEAHESPDETALHLRRVQVQGHDRFETRHRRKDGTLWDVVVNVTRKSDRSGDLLVCLRDISAAREQQRTLQQVAHHDGLTGLPNRSLLADRLTQNLARCARTGEMMAVCLLDLDGFKAVNDQLGHKAGDQLLVEVAQRLRDGLRHDDTAARLGGDEFVLLLGGFADLVRCRAVLDRLLQSVAAPYQVVGQLAQVSCSIGVALFPNEGSDPDGLLRRADQAMYQAKKAGKNQYVFSDNSDALQVTANAQAVRKIARALAAGQFELLYQPRVNVTQGRLLGVEALARWRHPVLGLLSPAEFVPLIEQEDLVVAVGEWVLRQALQQQRDWLAQGLRITVDVNLAERQWLDHAFPERLGVLLQGHPADLHGCLRFDVTESAAQRDLPGMMRSIAACRALGVGVVLDDFGTGFSALAHLKRLAVDALKIDRSFIAGLHSRPQDLALVQSVIALGQAFGREVSAEGVETLDQLLLLRELGCDIVQGYYVARPMSAQALAVWWSQFQPSRLWDLNLATLPSRDDFELLLAQSQHRYWIDRFVTLPPAALAHEACPFDLTLPEHACRCGRLLARAHESGHWLAGTPALAQLEATHAQIHSLAADWLQAQESLRAAAEGAQADPAVVHEAQCRQRLVQGHQAILDALAQCRLVRAAKASDVEIAHP